MPHELVSHPDACRCRCAPHHLARTGRGAVSVPESDELRDEQFWRDGGGFRWCWPRFNVSTPADKRVRALFNRYPHNVIGAGVVLFGRYWGVRWKRS